MMYGRTSGLHARVHAHDSSPRAARPAVAGAAPRARPRAWVAGLLARERLAAALALEVGSVPLEALERTLLGPAADFLTRPSKGLRARLVEIGWDLSGVRRPVPRLLPAIVELIHAGSLIVDDIEDGSRERRGEPALHTRYGLGPALNAGNWLYFWPLVLLRELALPLAVEVDLHRRIARTLARCHLGQALDLGVQVGTLDADEVRRTVAALAELKTGSLTALSATIGPVAAGAPAKTVAAIGRFGLRFGMALQMLDDLGNLRGAGAPARDHEDLRLGRPTYVWSWLAERVTRARFHELQRELSAVTSGDAAPTALAATLTGLVEEHGSRTIRAGLARAVTDLRTALGAGVSLAALEDAIARLEASYG